MLAIHFEAASPTPQAACDYCHGPITDGRAAVVVCPYPELVTWHLPHYLHERSCLPAYRQLYERPLVTLSLMDFLDQLQASLGLRSTREGG